MYSDWVGPATWGFLALWLTVLSWLVLRQSRFLESLFPKSGERDIRRKFEEVLGQVGFFSQELNRLRDRLGQVAKLDLGHIQRVELLRYNPYDDTGGDQSFTVCLLNDLGSGVVITSLHARSGTRVFAKPITEGKTQKFKLSKEEEEVIKKALKSR